MKRYSQEFKDQIIQEVKAVGNVASVARKHNITVTTVHSWIRKQVRKPMDDLAKRNRELERELEDKELEVQILKELLKKTNAAWLGD